MTHLTTEQLHELIDGSLSLEDSAALQDHINQCATCREDLQYAKLLEQDLKVVKSPEMAPGFALQVAYKTKLNESTKVFNQSPFKVFRFTLSVSLGICILAFALLLWPVEMSLPKIQGPGGFYSILAVICLLFVFTLDKMLNSLMGKKL